MQIFIYCKATLHVSGVTAPIIRSIKNCTRSLRYRSYYLYRYSPPTMVYVFPVSLIRATCHACLILMHLVKYHYTFPLKQ